MSTVFVAMPRKSWPNALTPVRVFDNRMAAQKYCQTLEDYISTEMEVHQTTICSHCGK